MKNKNSKKVTKIKKQLKQFTDENYVELFNAAKTYYVSAEAYMAELDRNLEEADTAIEPLLIRAESSEAMLVDMKQQLETVEGFRDYFEQLAQDRWDALETAYHRIDKLDGELARERRGWSVKFLDWMEEKISWGNE